MASPSDLKECQKTPAPCAHRCKEIEEGGYECYCDAGYTLDTDGVKCNGKFDNLLPS